MSNFAISAQNAAQETSLHHQHLQWLLQNVQHVAGPAGPSAEDISFTRQQMVTVALDLLMNGDFQVRWDVAKLLPKLGPEAIAPLIDILNDDEADWELLWFTTRILGEFQGPVVIHALINCLKTADAELSAVAVEALANLGGLAVEALAELLQEDDYRLLAVRSLSRIRCPETVGPLMSVANDPEPAIRAAAIEAISSFHDPKISPVLVMALQDPVAAVRREAVIGLGLRTDWQDPLDRVTLLQPCLMDLDLDVCRQAAIALGRVGSPTAVDALLSTLRSPLTPPVLQIEIIRVLGQTVTESVIQVWQELFLAASSEVIHEIVRGLASVQQPDLQPRAVGALIYLLSINSSSNESAEIRQAIALGLGHLGHPQAFDPLIQLLADPDMGVKLHAIAALKQLDGEESRQRLEGLVRDRSLDDSLVQGIRVALEEW